MAREPVAGRVKSRLARQVGTVEATRFYRIASRVVLDRLSADRRWRTVLAVSPDTATCSPAWPLSIARFGQGSGGLGERMQRIMRLSGPGPVVIVGTDIPGVGTTHIAAAFQALRRNDVVFGPAADGGFWLVGLRRSPRILPMFGNVRWSGPHTLSDTLSNLRHRRIAFISTLHDVDEAADLERMAAWFGRRVLPVNAAIWR